MDRTDRQKYRETNGKLIGAQIDINTDRWKIDMRTDRNTDRQMENGQEDTQIKIHTDRQMEIYRSIDRWKYRQTDGKWIGGKIDRNTD